MRGSMTQRVLQLVYDLFCGTDGAWPTLGDFQRALSRQVNGAVDAVLVLQRIPVKFLKPFSGAGGYPDPSERIILTAEGIERCTGSAEDIANLVIAVKWLARTAERQAVGDGFEHGLRFTTRELAEAVSLSVESDPVSVNRLVAILLAEGLVKEDDGNRE